MTAEVRCEACADCGHVCENHTGLPWAGISGDARSCDCGGAGMPCPKCCDPVPQDGTHSVMEAFTPRKFLKPVASIVAAILLTSCATPAPMPTYTKQTDICLYDEFYMRCLDTAQIKFKARNDGSVAWSTAEIRCSNMAYGSSLRNSTKVEPRCVDPFANK